MSTSGGNGFSRDSHYQYQRLIQKYQSSDAEVMDYLPQLMEVSIITTALSNQTTKIDNSAFSDYSTVLDLNSGMSEIIDKNNVHTF